MLKLDGRESTCVDENDRLLEARIARLDGLALVEGNGEGRVYLIAENDDDAFRLKTKRRLFGFEADDSMAPGNWRFGPAVPPDIWYNLTVTTLTMHMDSRA